MQVFFCHVTTVDETTIIWNPRFRCGKKLFNETKDRWMKQQSGFGFGFGFIQQHQTTGLLKRPVRNTTRRG